MTQLHKNKFEIQILNFNARSGRCCFSLISKRAIISILFLHLTAWVFAHQPHPTKPIAPSDQFTYYYNLALKDYDDINLNKSNLHYADSALAVAKNNDQIVNQIKANILIGEIYTHMLTKYEGWSQGHLEKAKKHFETALKLAESINNLALISEIYSATIYFYFRANDFDIASTLAQKHIRLLEANNLLDETPYAFMGLIYGRQGDLVTALNYFNKNIDVLIKMNKEPMVSGVYSDIGNTFFAVNNYDSARYFYLKGLDIAKKYNDDKGLSFIKDNIGLTYLSQQKYKNAIEWLLEALDHRRAVNWLEGAIVTMHHLGDAYLQYGLPDASKTILLEAFHLTGGNSQLYNNELTSDLLAKAYAALGQYDSAYHYINIAHHYQNELWHKDTERSIRASINGIALEKEKLQSELKKSEYQNLLTTALAGLLLISSVAGIYIYKSRKNKLLRIIAEKDLKADEEKLARLELAKKQQEEIAALKENELQRNILTLNSELLGYSHIIAQKNEALNHLLLTIKQLESANDGILTKQDIHKLNNVIKDKIDDENDWVKYLENFNSINPNFFSTLSGKHPHLTTNDMRLCVYMFMSLNSSEIANIMNISMESLRNSRMRLRQKMGLDGHIALDQYIRSLLDKPQVA